MWIPEYLSKILHLNVDKRHSRSDSRLFSIPHPKHKALPWWQKPAPSEDTEKVFLEDETSILAKRISMLVHSSGNATIKMPDSSIEVLHLYLSKGSKVSGIIKILETAPHFLSREVCDILRIENQAISSVTENIKPDNEEDVLENMVMSVVKGIIFGGEEGNIEIKQKIWEHSYASAIAIKHISKHFNIKRHNIPFLSALLHDIGRVSLLRTIAVTAPNIDINLALFDLLGSKLHEEAGGNIIGKMKLPEIVVATIANHHSKLENNDKESKLRGILQLADICANHCGHGFAQYPDPILNYHCISYLGITKENAGPILDPIPRLLIASIV